MALAPGARSTTQDHDAGSDDEYHRPCGDGFPQAGHHVTENFASQRGHRPPVLNVSNGMPHPSGPHDHRIPGVYAHEQSGHRISVTASHSSRAEPNPAPRSPIGEGRG